MNTEPHAIRILCYGDSNTWGYIPGTSERYPTTARWTGLLQAALGNNFEIIEEGLNGRTTVVDDPKTEGKNGATYLKPCLKSQYPLNFVILMLGTNDLKERFTRTPEQIAQGIEELLKIIKNPDFNYNKKPRIMLLAPPIVDESVAGVQDNFSGAEQKSRQLGSLYKSVSEKYSTDFIDIAKIVSPSKKDGCHLAPEAHKKITTVVIERIKKIYGQD